MITYVKEELVDLALLILSLEVNITKGVNNKDLAILSNNSLASTSRSSSRGRSSSSRGSLSSTARLLSRTSSIALGRLLLHTALSSVLGQRGSLFLVASGRGRCSRGWSGSCVDARDVKTTTPGGVAGELDVALDKLLLSLPAHVQSEVVKTTTYNEEKANDNRAQAGAVSVVVVIGALPEREAIGEEVVVSVALGATEDVGDEGETSLSLAGLLHSSLDLSIGRRLSLCASLLVLCSLGSHSLSDLVRVQISGLLAIGLGNVIERGRGRDAEDVVEVGSRVGLIL